MEKFKEFQGKSLDEAISEACTYYNVSREKLEVEIIEDAKSGIFGLVGARKAKIKAKRMQFLDAVEDVLGRKNSADATKTPASTHKEAGRGETKTGRGADHKHERKSHHEQERHAPENAHSPKHDSRHEHKQENKQGARRDSVHSGEHENAHERQDGPAPHAANKVTAASPAASPARMDTARKHAMSHAERKPSPIAHSRLGDGDGPDRNNGGHDDGHDDGLEEGLVYAPFEQLDTAKICQVAEEVIVRLTESIVGRVPIEVECGEGRVHVRIQCGEDSGLLIGREGQTLASLQYLASRMVSRAMCGMVRVQLDAGEYRTRQDEKLREMALSLAARVCETGRSYSTRPLSSYHRRVVHMALQDMPEVQTRSSGDGPLKRVVLLKKRH